MDSATATALANGAALVFSHFAWDRLVPLGMLLMMAGMFIWVLFMAQRREDFDASQFLRDDRGKLSFQRLAGFICLMAHCWAFITRVNNDKVTFDEFLLWAGVWSGSVVVLQALETWRGVKTAAPAQLDGAPNAERN